MTTVTATKSGTGWTVDVTLLGLSGNLSVNDFIVTHNSNLLDDGSIYKLDAQTIVYTGPPLASGTVIVDNDVPLGSANSIYNRIKDYAGLETIQDIAGLEAALNDRQLLDSDLTAIAASGTGAAGLQVLQQATAAGVRGAIDAEIAFTPGSILRTTLTGVGLERRASDGSVWLNGKLTQAPATITQRALSQRGLVPNGTCEIPAVLDAGGVLRAEGWSNFGIDTANKISGLYSIQRQTVSTGVSCDNFFSIPPGVIVGWYSAAFAGDSIPNGLKYSLALSCWDGEPTPNPVDTLYVNYISGSASTLSRPLTVGDAAVFIDKSGVTPNTYTGTYRGLALYGSDGYVSPSGTQYKAPQSGSPLGFYTRWVQYAGLGTPATIEDLGTEYKINLAAGAWSIANPSGGAWPIGTKCGATAGGDGNFVYPGPTAYRDFIPGAWDIMRPEDTPSTSNQFKIAVYGTVPNAIAKNLPPGTARVKIALYLLTPCNMRFHVNLFEIG